MHRGAPDETLAVARDEVRVGESMQLVEDLAAPVVERPRRNGAERRLIDARRGVQLVDPPQGSVTLASAELCQRFDANATLTHGLRRGGQRQRRPCEREDLLVRADDLDEAAAHDELAARRAVVRPETGDFRGTLVQLGAELRPHRRANALPAEPWIDGEPQEVAA